MKKNLVMIMAMLAAGIAFAADGNKEKGGDKPKHHGPPPFAKLDADKDGKVTFEEFKAHAPKDATPERIEAKFKKMDANSDGSLTKDEFPKPGEGGKKHGEGDNKAEK